MNFPSIPKKSLNLRALSILESEVVSWDTEEEQCASHCEGQFIIVPNFIKGDGVELVISKYGNYAYVKDTDTSVVTELSTVFFSEEEVWQKACSDVVEASGSNNSMDRLGGTIEIACAAIKLIESREWWTADLTRKWTVGKVQISG